MNLNNHQGDKQVIPRCQKRTDESGQGMWNRVPKEIWRKIGFGTGQYLEPQGELGLHFVIK